jgi:hypothetical protein
MKLTRDGAIYWLGALGGAAFGLLGHYDLLLRAFPGLGPLWQARIELIGFAATGVSLYLRMSPLPLSSSNEMATRDHDQALTVTGKLP